MPEWIGQTIGNVRIEKFLARGGMAEVYLGIHLTLARPVAVKVLHSYKEQENRSLERFEREARVVAAMRHPNIVQIHDFDTIDGHPYIVMEYLKGPTLANYLRPLHQHEERIPHQLVARLLSGLAAALGYAHEQGVIHRDIKPSNILLRNKTDEIPLDKPLPEDVEAVLTDFGLVRLIDTDTTSDGMSGTLTYMSPEQASGDKIDHRSDIYSLGIVLYELLAGRVPFEADSIRKLLSMQIDATPLPIPGLPASVQAVLDRALQKDPKDRYQSSGELALDFSRSIGLIAESVKIQEPEPVPPVSTPPIQTHTPSNPMSSEPKLVALPADLLASNNARDVTITIKGNQNAVATQGGRANVIHSGGTFLVFQAWRERMEREIERLENVPEGDKVLLIQNVEQIAREAEKGEKADPKRIERLLNMLPVMAPDIFDVALTTLTDPFVGIRLVIQKVGDKARVMQKA